MQQHILSVLVSNKAGVLTKVTALFSRRCFNIDSLAVGTTENKDISRITIIANGDDYTLEQLIKQLNKLIDVIKVKNLTSTETVCRELALIKISGIGSDERKEILQFSEIYRSKIVDVAPDTVTVEITGTTDKIASFLALVEKMGKIEMVRTGTISIERGSKTIEV